MAVVPAAEQALGILRYLANQASPVPAATISRSLALPRSTTYHLLDTLIASGFVVRYPDQRTYGLGLTAYELASGYVRQEPLQRLARRPMADLADRCGNSAHLSVLLGRDVVYVIEERAPGRPLLITDVGVRLPAHATASGRAMLAALPQQQVRALYPDKDAFGAGDDQAPASLSALRRVLVEVRHAGWASEDGEVTPGLASRAMPVLDGNGYPVAAVAVTFPLEERTPQLLAGITAAIGATVHTLHRRLGGL
ncbi:IclR family transcriptional regulator [Nocardioides eburneiflavus]|uniref:Glycerol operon regulatory protein n=1 Tax=Nocardioides eburneiflavus TaxID=2518372 RepID=A0A4Z1CFA1_9ACTN|nr:IclR family transcriptional regulator [Nocardioides eburneiflavus]TGN64188.1 IclR family transcriptional regulator [Nocardioides eburneiflavus]